MQSEVRGSIGILGYGVDGQCVADWLCGLSGIDRVFVFDDGKKCEYRNAKCELGSNLDGVDLVFRSPGFPLDHKLMVEAKEKGIPVTSSTTEVLKGFGGVTVGVTGSNGKTTCVALIEEFLKAEFGDDRVGRGGNDGIPRMDLIENWSMEKNAKCEYRNAKKFLVLELSSFQLIDCPVSPNIAVVLNITPNHLNWHKDMKEYAEAKRQIVAHQKSEHDEGFAFRISHFALNKDIAVLNREDSIVKKFAEGLESGVHWFTDDVPENIKCVTHPDTIRAAVTAARALKVSEENIGKVLKEFPGVPHRLEFIREIDGVKWYNDSSCTTPESVITACEVFPEGKLVILMGGRDKGMDFSSLYEVIKKRGVRVVSYGEMAETFRSQIPSELVIENPEPSDFEKTIEVTRSASKSGDNVVLSPACASFDMFKNAKERGRRFSLIVREMGGK